MMRCAFLRGRALFIPFCFMLMISITSIASRKEDYVSDRSLDQVPAIVAALQRNILHQQPNPTDQRPIEQFSVQSQQAQPIISIGESQAFIRNKHQQHHGERRRVQDACASQSDVFYSCLPDDQCEGCYSGLFASIQLEIDSDPDILCGEIESRLCAVNNNTCGCGCPFEAEIFIQCYLVEQGCENIVACADTKCEEELIRLSDCDTATGNNCNSCVGDAVDVLFATDDNTTCTDLQSTVCTSSITCGCEQCADEVELWFSCASAEDCPNFSCSSTAPPSSVSSPMTTPVPVLETNAPTPAPTKGVVCYVCGEATMEVTAGLTFTIDGDEIECTLLEQTGLLQYFGEPSCDLAQSSAAEYCDCVPNQPPTNPPVAPPVAFTPPPSYSDPCYVCGDPDLLVDPTKSVEIGNELRPCGDVQNEYETSQQVSSFECNILVEAVTKSCNCGAARTSSSPPVSGPVAVPVAGGTGSGGGGSFNPLYLSALVAIPLIAVIVYLGRSQTTENVSVTKSDPISAAAHEDEFSGTPPAAPSPSHNPMDASATTSMRSDEDYIYGRRPVAAAAAILQNSGGGRSGSDSVRSHEDHHADAVGDVSGGSGRSSDPSGLCAKIDSTSDMSAVASLHGSGGYLPHYKDQCRASTGGVAPMAAPVFVAELDTASQPDHDERKRPADPSGIRDA